MIEELFYKFVQHARVHELIPGYTIQLRLHVLSLRTTCLFAVKSYMCHFGTNGHGATLALHPGHLQVHEGLQWLLGLSTCLDPPTTRAVGTAFTVCTPTWGQVTVVHTEATTNTPDMTWEEIMQRHGRHTTGYTVLTKAEIDTLLQSRRITNIFRKDRRHIIVDSSVQDAVNTAAFDVSMGYMQVHNDEEDSDVYYILQFEIDYSNLIDSVYNKIVSI